MAKQAGVNDPLEAIYAALSPRLQQAARFVLDHPQAVAMRSMRAVAAAAGVHPSAMLRLARMLGHPGYEEFRESYRLWLGGGKSRLSSRALTLRGKGREGAAPAMIDEVVARELDNIRDSLQAIGADRLEEAQRRLAAAGQIYVLGLRALYAPAFYFHYMCRMFLPRTILLDGHGGTLADDIRSIGPGDVLLALSISPYARATVQAVRFARAQGAEIVTITDSPHSPVAEEAALSLVVANAASPVILSSVLPTLAVTQVLIALLLTRSGEESVAALAASDRQLVSLEVYVREGRRRAP